MHRVNLEERDVEIASVAVSSVSLESFRNYVALELDLSPHFNVLTGSNGQGKTNLLEALYLLATTRLLRGQKDLEAILDGCDRAVVSASVHPSDTKLSVKIEKGARKRALINGLALSRASDMLGRLPCVSVSAVDMEIVRGEPSDRRMFLDLELSSLFPSYLRHLTHYKRALEQRNSLLKDSRDRFHDSSVFEPWEEQLAVHGEAIREARAAYINRLSPRFERLHSELGNGELASLSYGVKEPGDLREQLSLNRGQEVQRGSTIYGPHRDDLEIEIVGRDARLFGSQGQQRTSVIALKLASLEVARQELSVAPLLLLDDIFSDLDASRRALLVDVVVQNAGQVVLTCTEASAAGPRILEQARVFSVCAGRVEPL